MNLKAGKKAGSRRESGVKEREGWRREVISDK
jgi:hypothetical protein